MAKRNRSRRKPSQKQYERQKASRIRYKMEQEAERYNELWEMAELIRWIKSGYDNPGTAIENYAKKHGFDLTSASWTV
jgi:hypothetical protein